MRHLPIGIGVSADNSNGGQIKQVRKCYQLGIYPASMMRCDNGSMEVSVSLSPASIS